MIKCKKCKKMLAAHELRNHRCVTDSAPSSSIVDDFSPFTTGIPFDSPADDTPAPDPDPSPDFGGGDSGGGGASSDW